MEPEDITENPVPCNPEVIIICNNNGEQDFRKTIHRIGAMSLRGNNKTRLV
jgi:hypothetical protein